MRVVVSGRCREPTCYAGLTTLTPLAGSGAHEAITFKTAQNKKAADNGRLLLEGSPPQVGLPPDISRCHEVVDKHSGHFNRLAIQASGREVRRSRRRHCRGLQQQMT
jgi:hypothetical protein